MKYPRRKCLSTLNTKRNGQKYQLIPTIFRHLISILQAEVKVGVVGKGLPIQLAGHRVGILTRHEGGKSQKFVEEKKKKRIIRVEVYSAFSETPICPLDVHPRW